MFFVRRSKGRTESFKNTTPVVLNLILNITFKIFALAVMCMLMLLYTHVVSLSMHLSSQHLYEFVFGGFKVDQVLNVSRWLRQLLSDYIVKAKWQ